MKSYFTLFLLSCNILVQAQNIEKIDVPPKIDEVKVYLNGAEIIGEYQLQVRSGRNRITFKGISPSVKESSLQLTSSKGIDILSVMTQDSKDIQKISDLRIIALKDSIDRLSYQIKLVQNEIDSYHEEKEALKSNRYIGGSQSGISLSELTKAADFFRLRSVEINNALTDLDLKIKWLKSQFDEYNIEYSEYLKTFNGKRKEVVILMNTDEDRSATFELRYLVSNTGWSPSYDLISAGVDEPVALKYKAQIYNNTAIDWKEVKLSLSTADPFLGASRPYLSTWTLNQGYRSTAEGKLEYKELGGSIQLDSAIEYEDITVSELSTSFDIPLPYSISANSEPYIIELTEKQLPASYEYLAIPKVELSTFLLAHVTGWNNLNLIDGTANVYFGNAYIGESQINTRSMGDTLELSLGRDNNVLVSRQKIIDQSETKFIGSKKKESFVYEIQIKNNRQIPVTIKLQDQLPVSQLDDIIVEPIDISGAQRNNINGRLQWIETINPGENRKYVVAFDVKYPKNMEVSITKNKVVRTPRFRH